MNTVRGRHGDESEYRGPTTVRIQPEPVAWRVADRTVRGVSMTAIQRTWGATDGPRCRLCPRAECNYDPEDRCCLILVDGVVADDAAPLFSTIGLLRRGSGPLVEAAGGGPAGR